MKVHEALAHVMEDVQAVAKRDRNTSQNFNFRGIDAVVNAVAPALRKHGVIVAPVVESYDYKTVEVGQKRTQMGHVIVKVRYVFIGPEGDNLYTDVYGEAMDSGDKAIAKAMSVAFRIALLQALALPTDEPDPDASSYERSEREEKQEMTPELFDGALAAISIAKDLAALNEIGASANKYEMSKQQREELRLAYLDRKNVLESEAN